MKLIQSNCRAQFAAEDIEFILSVLGGKIGTAECLVKLLADEDSRDLILDDEAASKFQAASTFISWFETFSADRISRSE